MLLIGKNVLSFLDPAYQIKCSFAHNVTIVHELYIFTVPRCESFEQLFVYTERLFTEAIKLPRPAESRLKRIYRQPQKSCLKKHEQLQFNS